MSFEGWIHLGIQTSKSEGSTLIKIVNIYAIRPGKFDYLFLIHKNLEVGGHFLLFIIKENTPSQAV